MASVPSKRAFVLALSHREKARALMAEADHAATAGTLDLERYTALRDFYTTHLQHAESRLARLQDRERRKLDSLQHQLRATINDQARLVDRAVAGRVTAEKANALNRQYQAEIANLESAIDATESLLNATHSSELGGVVDLPLEEYNTVNHMPITSVERWRARRWALLFAGAFVTLLLIFLMIRQGPSGRSVDAAFASISPAIIGVTVTNTGAHEGTLYVPWPEGGADANDAFGLQLYVQEDGRDSFSLLPNSDECWKSNGLPILGTPLTLLPNIPTRVTLDLPRLQQLVDRPQAVRIALIAPNGRVLSDQEFVVSPS